MKEPLHEIGSPRPDPKLDQIGLDSEIHPLAIYPINLAVKALSFKISAAVSAIVSILCSTVSPSLSLPL